MRNQQHHPKKLSISKKKEPIDNQVRSTYSALINSPKQTNLPSITSEIDFEGLSDKQLKKLSSKYMSQDEKEAANEIEAKGKKGLHDALNMYNRFHGNHLFEPEDKITGKSEYALKVKSIIPERFLTYSVSPTLYSPNSPKRGFTPLQTTFDMVFKNHALPEKFLQEVNSSGLQQRRYPVSTFESNYEDDIQIQTLNDSLNVKQMRDISEMIKPERPLTEEEKSFFKMIKDNGSTIDVQFHINNQRDLVHIKDNRKQTPLHWAVKRENLEIIEVLIRNGASLFEKDMALRTPFDIAKRIKNPHVTRYLGDKIKEIEKISQQQ